VLSVIDELGWAAAGVSVLYAVGQVIPGSAFLGKGKHGAHAKSPGPDDQSPYKRWHEFRYALILSSTLTVALLADDKHQSAAVIAGLAAVGIGVWEIAALLRLANPVERAKAVSNARFLLSSVLATLGIVFGGWRHPTGRWLLGLSLLVLVVREFDSWFKAYQRRKSSGGATGPP
jgi:hypothetical protein